MIVKLKTTDWLHGECWPQCLRGHRWGAEMESCCWGDGNRPRINNTSYFCCCCFVFRTHHEAYGILVPWPGIEPMPSAVKMWSPNHWTSREFPIAHFILEPKGKKVLIQPGIWVTGILKKDLKKFADLSLFREKKVWTFMTFSFKKQLPWGGEASSHLSWATSDSPPFPHLHFSVSMMSVKQVLCVDTRGPALNWISPEILINNFSSDSS